ncbi:MAG TPA: hypothetical protein VF791_00785 [Pyrinomonadaceae bacterium]
MSPSKSRQYHYLPNRLYNIISHAFDHSPLALDLFNRFLSRRTYRRSFALKLIGVAKRSNDEPWEIRRLAALMLENQVLKLSPDNIEEFDFLLVQLGLKSSPGKRCEITDSVLKEGYSTTHLNRFILEFRRKLERLNRIHERMAGSRTSQSAMRDFIKMSKCDCKISVARYFFKPEEVVEQIVKQLRTSKGVPDLEHPPYVDKEAAHTFDLLPDYEATILRELCKTSIIYWVSKSTSSEINSLVEYPLTAIVLVIKPPGSHLEFEIKRAGKRRGHVLNIVYWRGGHEVPIPHRLDGGSMLGYLRHEAKHGSRFSIIYRHVHGSEAPMCLFVSRSAIFGVPKKGAEEKILEYFTSPRLFGNGFYEMRKAMRESVTAFDEEEGANGEKIPGLLGLSIQFLNHSIPGQAILSGTSSFRLNRVAAYLTDQGPEIYFKRGLRVEYSRRDAKWLADEILEEILGVYSPPAVPYRSYKQYVAAAFAVGANRDRADQIFLDSVQQIGTFWGTLLALRGFSWGESFVSRNVGLKSFWSNGHWKVKAILMDHDCLTVVDKSERVFQSLHAFEGISTDARYIGGDLIATRQQQTALFFLQQIYRVRENVGNEGKALFYRAIKKAYGATHDAVLTNSKLRNLFNKIFVERLCDWDMIVSSYLKTKSNGAGVEAWKEKVRTALREKGYSQKLIETHLETVETYSGFLENQSFLY